LPVFGTPDALSSKAGQGLARVSNEAGIGSVAAAFFQPPARFVV
jgi:hypothetical protein